MKILLYGAGLAGIQALRAFGKGHVDAFLDAKVKGECYGVPVYTVDEYFSAVGGRAKADDVLIFLTSTAHAQSMIAELKKYGVRHCFSYPEGTRFVVDAEERLDADAWGAIDQQEELKSLLERVACPEPPNSWTAEMMKLTQVGDRVLEIGCGSGQTSLYLARHGRRVTALDYAAPSIERVCLAAREADIEIEAIQADATETLPFVEDAFDIIFQAGLLEHFTREERVAMLRNWAHYGKRMVSMIPNAHSLAYHLGKDIKEQKGTWSYGLEMPQASLAYEFTQAGLADIKEYSIGMQEALTFLPEDHYMRIAIERWAKEHQDTDDWWGQGYLLVTTGVKTLA